jgi:hypothetical protein
VSNSPTLWHRKCFCGFRDFVVLAFFLLGCIKHVSSCSDDEEPQRDAAAAPSTRAIILDQPSAQEVEPAVQAPRTTRASVKKVPVTRSTKRSKKSKEADISLEAHEPTSSSDDVSGCIALIFLAPSVYLYVLPSSGTDEEIRRLGH